MNTLFRDITLSIGIGFILSLVLVGTKSEKVETKKVYGTYSSKAYDINEGYPTKQVKEVSDEGTSFIDEYQEEYGEYMADPEDEITFHPFTFDALDD